MFKCRVQRQGQSVCLWIKWSVDSKYGTAVHEIMVQGHTSNYKWLTSEIYILIYTFKLIGSSFRLLNYMYEILFGEKYLQVGTFLRTSDMFVSESLLHLMLDYRKVGQDNG